MGAMHRLVWVGLATLSLVACAKSTSGGSSETHFLALCNASCDEGLSCVCGICSEACDGDGACEDLNSEASCQVAAGDACGTPRVCDVQCSDDDDCSDVSSDHVCDGGRCRAPMIASTAGHGGASGEGGSSGHAGASGAAGGSGGSFSDPMPAECTTDGVSAFLLGATVDPCHQLTREELDAPAIAACVRDKLNAGQPFFVRWQEPGDDSRIERGLVGFMSRGYMIYELYYDSLGFSDGTTRPLLTQWTRVNSLGVADDCETIAGCFAYDPLEGSECGCGMEEELFIECRTPPVQECPAPSCLIDDICYPLGETSEDGCCTCEEGGYTCIEPGWCPSWPLIGKRCESDTDCMTAATSGLRCEPSLSGDAGICTRDCNFGCPSGTACTQTGDYEGELCMRACSTDANCNIDVFGEPLGSECGTIGEGGLYCR